MCGISGIYNCLNKKVNSIKIIEKIIKLQEKRGPDGKGLWQSACDKVVLGHNRLSIIDLSDKAKQPFVSKDNNLTITFNGEIYNYKEIRSKLLQKNITFRSNSDTEVILEAYKFWGIEFLSKLRGMFSFALWDNSKKKLILARDPFGIKPLYYLKNNGVFYFASQIKSLKSINDINFEFSNAGLVSYYLWGNIQEPFTLYKNIKSLTKGTCLIIDKDNNEEIINYANINDLILNTEEIKFNDKNDQSNYLKDIIEETVNYHHVSDVPRTLLLSAGVDSNVILSSMSKESKKNCSALTLDFDYKKKENETTLAKESAQINGIQHSVKGISNNEFAELIENFYKDMDSPTNDGFNNYLISYLAKKNNSKIIISGIGGDELFFGYPSFNLIPKINKNIKYLPKSNFVNSFFKKNIYSFLKKNKFKTKYSGLIEYGREINTGFLLTRSLFLPFEIEELISKKDFKEGYEELNFINNSYNEIKEIKDTRLAIMYLEIKYYLCSKLLRDSDWVSMSHSIELRTPFVDWFFFKKMIPLIKSDKNFNKSTVINSFKNNLPKNLDKRKKTGFSIPHNEYLKKLSRNKQYANPIRDWSILSYEKYLNYEQ
jgi:asparagine synthase (glutamine-hydrolysing)